jgi:(p)ppGpp synthase/HD superfamily hydrolase
MKVDEALKYAVEKLDKQYRRGIRIPSVTHSMEVMKKVSYYTSDEDLWVSGALHDIKEDGKDTDDIPSKFGDKVYRIVQECTRDTNRNEPEEVYAFMESFHNKSAESLLVKIADRSCNVMDFVNAYNSGTGSKSVEYSGEYALQSRPLIEALRSKDLSKIEGYNATMVKHDIEFLVTVVKMFLGFDMFSTEADKFINNNYKG